MKLELEIIFGPIVVCATFVATSNVEYLHDLKVTDSKKITDDCIKLIAPKIMEKSSLFCICFNK